jgi:3'(2'), 5'-bisphosphate nucleotidase
MNNASEIKDLLPIAIKAAEEACKVILEVYDSNNFETERKEDNSPLTLADRRSHDVIEAILKTTGLPVLSEEGKDIPHEARRNWARFWMVDPLDGTKEFLKRNGEFTVNIALIEGNTPVLGVVALPVTGDLYYGMMGRGAHLRSKGSLIRLKERTPADLTQKGLRVVASRSHMNDATRAYIDKLNDPILISAGSSLKFMALAKGDADLYPRYVPCMEWDTAAADVIVSEVGLKTVDAETLQPLMYNKQTLLNPYFICGV